MNLNDYDPLIPILTSNSGPNVKVSSNPSNLRTALYRAFAGPSSNCDTEPNKFVKVFIDFTNPVYAEFITFEGNYLETASIVVDGVIIVNGRPLANDRNEFIIPKANRNNVKRIELHITGNGSYTGNWYFNLSNVQVYTPKMRTLIEMHDNLYTFNNGVASIVKSVNEAGLTDYKSGIDIRTVKGLDKVSPSFKVHVLDVSM